MADTSYEKTLNLAFRMIGRQARTVGQLREKLQEKSPASSEVIERVIKRLLELNYLNDENFAYQYATNKLNVKALGRKRLQQTLTQKQVPSEVAKKALNDIFTEQNEAELCQTALAKYIRSHGTPKDPKENKKLFGHLVRLGFPYDLVIKQIRAIGEIDMDEE
jgi:regulatory protein